MSDFFEMMRILRSFPRDIEYHGLTIPVMESEHYLAFDGDNKLWAFSRLPLWSEASQKWIPQEYDVARHILTLKCNHVNSKDSIMSF